MLGKDQEATLDKRRFRRKYLLSLATSPTVFAMVVGGASTVLAGWAFDMPGILPFAGLAAVVLGVGSFLTKLIVGDEARARHALKELEADVEDERRERLDALADRLSSDHDSRDEALLTDLRKLAGEFRRRDFWPDDLDSASTFDMMSGVETLFSGCVDSLERQLRLVEIARTMATEEARHPLLTERESILQDVGRCISQLGTMYSSIRGLQGHAKESSELARVRGELDRSLDVAARVRERMSAWDEEHASLQRTP